MSLYSESNIAFCVAVLLVTLAGVYSVWLYRYGQEINLQSRRCVCVCVCPISMPLLRILSIPSLNHMWGLAIWLYGSLIRPRSRNGCAINPARLTCDYREPCQTGPGRPNVLVEPVGSPTDAIDINIILMSMNRTWSILSVTIMLITQDTAVTLHNAMSTSRPRANLQSSDSHNAIIIRPIIWYVCGRSIRRGLMVES